LRIAEMQASELQSRLGATIRYIHYIDGTLTLVTPEVSFAWQHEFINDALSVKSRFASGAGEDFTVNGPAMGSDSLILGMGVSVQWVPNINSYLNFSTEVGRTGYTAESINASVRLNF